MYICIQKEDNISVYTHFPRFFMEGVYNSQTENLSSDDNTFQSTCTCLMCKIKIILQSYSTESIANVCIGFSKQKVYVQCIFINCDGFFIIPGKSFRFSITVINPFHVVI